MGEETFTSMRYKKYPKGLNLRAILVYLAGNSSQTDIYKKYMIRSKAKLQNWIKMYNSHEELKSFETGETIIISAKYSCRFPDSQFSFIIVVDRYLDYFSTIMDRL